MRTPAHVSQASSTPRRSRLAAPVDTTVRDIGAIIALGVIRWHRRRYGAHQVPSSLGLETGHTQRDGDPSAGTETQCHEHHDT
jgi:hypothetical protein